MAACVTSFGEPVSASTGQYAGTTVMQSEQDKGLAFMKSLTPDQWKVATISAAKTANNALSQAFRDNLVLDYAGLRAKDMTTAQRDGLLALVQEYVGNMAAGQSGVCAVGPCSGTQARSITITY